MNEPQKCAEILVECGYGKPYKCETIYKDVMKGHIRIYDENWDSKDHYRAERADPFSDTIEGRRQADVIENYLRDFDCNLHEYHLWGKSGSQYFDHKDNHHQWRLDRIKWCIGELIK